MPLIYINCPGTTFSSTARDKLAADLTDISLKAEGLPDTPFIRGTVWIYFNDYPRAHVYHGGKHGGNKVISVEINAFKGGLDKAAKKLIIEKFTLSICKHAGIEQHEVPPVYILFRDVEECDWGVSGKTITLDMLRNPNAG